MSSRSLTIGLFLSIALNLFLIGLLAGGWREYQDRALGTPPPPPPVADLVADPPPPAETRHPTAPATNPPQSRERVAEVRPPAPVRARALTPAEVGEAAPEVAPPDALSPLPRSPYRPAMASPLLIAARDLPPGARREFLTLLRVQSEAVRLDLRQVRWDRADAWRRLARGELSAAETQRILDEAQRREATARSRVERAVAEWARRQPPEIRARIGEALAQTDLSTGARRLQPDGPLVRPPPEPRSGAGES